jgi:hypothetical protein
MARRRRVPRSGMRSTVEAGGADPDNARRSVPVAVTFSRDSRTRVTVTPWRWCRRTRQRDTAEILGGRRVGIRIEPATLMFYDLATRDLLRTRKNPLTPQQVKDLRGARPAGPPPRPSAEPIRVQRRASNTGVIMVAGQKIALGRIHKHQTVTVLVSETTLTIEFGDGDTRVIRRTTTQPVRSIKGQRPADRYLSFLDHMSHISCRICVAHQSSDHTV